MADEGRPGDVEQMIRHTRVAAGAEQPDAEMLKLMAEHPKEWEEFQGLVMNAVQARTQFFQSYGVGSGKVEVVTPNGKFKSPKSFIVN